jgi:hypothetical protein
MRRETIRFPAHFYLFSCFVPMCVSRKPRTSCSPFNLVKRAGESAMSLFSALMASVSGMNAQANALSTISDNIANANTTGYKEAGTEFEDMLNEFSPSEYNAGGVGTVVTYGISQQGDPNSIWRSKAMGFLSSKMRADRPS